MITPVPLTPELLLANLKANPHPKQTLLEMAGGYAYITIDTHKLAYDGERWFACGQQITPQFGMNSLHQEIDRVFVVAQKIKDHVLAKTTTPSWQEIKADCVGPDLPTEQTFVSTDRYRELEAELVKVTAERDDLSVRVKQKTDVIKAQAAQIQQHSDGWEQTEAQLETMTTERDDARKNYLALINNNPLSPTINTIAEKLGVCPAEPGPMFEKIDRLKISLSTTEAQLREVERGRDHDDGIRSEIAVKVGLDSSASLGLILEMVNGEQSKKTIEWATKEMGKLRFERDAERIGNKWLSETVEDLKRNTVKLPNEHTLRRLFNRHNAPDKYDDGTPIPTIERFLLIIENLCRNADCAERRFEELNAISTRVNTESEDAPATLDEMGVPRWTTTNNYNERYLSLSARLRQLFQTHTKV